MIPLQVGVVDLGVEKIPDWIVSRSGSFTIQRSGAWGTEKTRLECIRPGKWFLYDSGEWSSGNRRNQTGMCQA